LLVGHDEREPVVVRGSLVNGKTRPQPAGTSLVVLEGLLAQPMVNVRWRR